MEWRRKVLGTATLRFFSPTVGRLKDDTYTVDGQEYHMNQHGFARDMDFDVLKVEADQVVLELHSSDQTKKLYPV